MNSNDILNRERIRMDKEYLDILDRFKHNFSDNYFKYLETNPLLAQAYKKSLKLALKEIRNAKHNGFGRESKQDSKPLTYC